MDVNSDNLYGIVIYIHNETSIKEDLFSSVFQGTSTVPTWGNILVLQIIETDVNVYKLTGSTVLIENSHVLGSTSLEQNLFNDIVLGTTKVSIGINTDRYSYKYYPNKDKLY